MGGAETERPARRCQPALPGKMAILTARETVSVQAVSTTFIQNLWVPDIYIYSMNSINRILTDYKGRLFIVNGNEILFRQELVITLWCPMRFNFYPLDKQVR